MPLVRLGVGTTIGAVGGTVLMKYCPKLDEKYLPCIFGTGLVVSTLLSIKYKPNTLFNFIKFGAGSTLVSSVPFVLLS